MYAPLGCRRPDPVEIVRVEPKIVEAPICSDCIHIDTKRKVLSVIKRGTVLESFPQTAFGRSGTGVKHRRGDSVTPVGEFKIAWKNPASKFKIFFGLDYPNPEYASRGLQEKVITKKEFERLSAAHKGGKTPPQDTPLGGYIGIHGIGKGSIDIHHALDWTDGCIALDNDQISKLDGLIHIGMRVIIR